MRIFATVLIGILCAVAFCTFFMLTSVMSYVGSADAVTATAKRVKLHSFVLDVADEAIAHEVRRSRGGQIAALAGQEAHAVFERVLADAWFYESFAAAYGDVVAALNDEHRITPIDLSGKKSELRAGLSEIPRKIDCTALLGADACADERARAQATAQFLAAVNQLTESIPNSMSLADVRGENRRWLDPESPERKRVRRAVGIIQIVRFVALGVLVVTLLLIVVINRSPLSRLLSAVGSVFAVSAIAYLIAVHALDSQPEQWTEEQRARERAVLVERGDVVGRIAADAAETVTFACIKDAFHGRDTMVMGIFGVGVVMIAFGVVVRRRN